MQIYKITTVLEITTTAKCIINLRGLWAFRLKKKCQKDDKSYGYQPNYVSVF